MINTHLALQGVMKNHRSCEETQN